MALQLKLQSKTLTPLTYFRRFSSSSSSPSPPLPPADSDGNGGAGDNEDSPPPPLSSLFSDIKERLKSPPTPPRRIPTDPPPPPPPLSSPKPAPTASFEEIRKGLASFRRSGGSPRPPSGERFPLSPPAVSSEKLFKNNVLNKSGGGGGGKSGKEEAAEKGARISFGSIIEGLRQFNASLRDRTGPRAFDLKAFQDSLRTWRGRSRRDRRRGRARGSRRIKINK